MPKETLYVMKSVLYFVFVCVLSANAFSQNTVGVFDNHADIGNPKKTGNAVYDPATQEYKISGGGYNIWFGRDEFHYAYKKLKGDFIVTANFELIGKGVDPHRKIGWMVRNTLDDNAAHVSATVHGDGLTVLQWRAMKGAFMRDPEDEIRFAKKAPQIVQLERNNGTYILRVANWGEPLQEVGRYKPDAIGDEVFVGLFISSHNENVVEEARVWNVRISKTVPENYNAYRQGYIGSRMEIMSPFDGKRKVIHEYTGSFEAPNWMPDGKNLLFNQEGSLYKIPVTGGTPEKLNTDFAKRNNNDHVISFDGKMLAISHHRDGLPGGGSTIYVLPLSGGTPKQITEKTPSYLHGWSPNGKELVFVGQRDTPVYDIYKVGINGGAETKLTANDKYHVDGPEYSPDGKFIYYNSSETNTMQLWRMKPDGSAKEQITFDEYNNWFPHISPDGKWIVFLSFPKEVAPGDHPFYKRVMLRMMPATGGAPRVVAYLYGGQGTINVPSWSPDSKYIAFVSN
jgi:Tol biopolymer transport system component